MLVKIEEDRIEILAKEIAEIISPIEESSMAEMYAYLDENLDNEVRKLWASFEEFLLQLKEKQVTKSFEELSLIKICPSDVDLFKGDYKLRIYAYDERKLDSRREFILEWKPEFITQYYSKHVEILEDKIPKKMDRLTTREKALIKLVYAERFAFYVSIAIYIFKDTIGRCISHTGIETKENCFLCFGRYYSDDFMSVNLLGNEEK